MRRYAGLAVSAKLRDIACKYGAVKLFKAYLDFTGQVRSGWEVLRSELQASGVTLTDCPHVGKKEIADKRMLGTTCTHCSSFPFLTYLTFTVDMFTYVIDIPPPATVIVISGDQDFAHAIAILGLRSYRVVVIAPDQASQNLLLQASDLVPWKDVISVVPKEDQDPAPEAAHRIQTQARNSSTHNRPRTSSMPPIPTSRTLPASPATSFPPAGALPDDQNIAKLRNAVYAFRTKMLTDIARASGNVSSEPEVLQSFNPVPHDSVLPSSVSHIIQVSPLLDQLSHLLSMSRIRRPVPTFPALNIAAKVPASNSPVTEGPPVLQSTRGRDKSVPASVSTSTSFASRL